jgi:hypothetical protein
MHALYRHSLRPCVGRLPRDPSTTVPAERSHCLTNGCAKTLPSFAIVNNRTRRTTSAPPEARIYGPLGVSDFYYSDVTAKVPLAVAQLLKCLQYISSLVCFSTTNYAPVCVHSKLLIIQYSRSLSRLSCSPGRELEADSASPGLKLRCDRCAR